MLKTLQIKNLALVEAVKIDFSPGLNVISGETGAGKSIIVGALSLLLGERADKNAIREGAEQCFIEAVFSLPDSTGIDRLLDECGLPACAGGDLILRRIISAPGAGRQFINDSPATIQSLRAVGELLVDMHGPHDHQSLLKPEFQLGLLDAYAEDEKQLSLYRNIFAEHTELLQRKESLLKESSSAPHELDLIAFQVKELEEARLDENEENEIISEHKTLANAGRIIELTSLLEQSLTESDTSVFGRLATLQPSLAELARLVPQAVGWQEESKAIISRLRELSREISSFAAKIDADPARLQQLENRLALYRKLKNKYGGSVADLKNTLAKSRERLKDLQNLSERLGKIEADIKDTRARLEEAGKALGEKRRAAAARFAKATVRQLKALAFNHAAFSVRIEETEPQLSGLDRVEFLFSPNAGESEKPLRQIASSGEMSRVMLALKTILASHDRIPVLVFDEIDENIGGQTAQVVGRKLSELAGHHQIICITHLPQVAVYGKNQFTVRKKTAGGRTVSGVYPLNNEERVKEIARMLGGEHFTSVTMKHAREMMEKARENEVARSTQRSTGGL